MRATLKHDALAVLSEAQDMALATVGPDGAPHATVVSFASQGLRLYFGCGPESRKAQNLGAGGRVAATVTLPYKDWAQIRGLSIVGRARRIEGADELARASTLFLGKFPEISQYVAEPGQPIQLYEVTPTTMALLDYRQGFGHTDWVEIGTEDLAA